MAGPSKKNDQVVGKVYKTKNLSQFKKIKGNRPVDELNVRRIAKSMEEHGVMMCPIIVNKKMQVIDGQHRLDAAKLSGNAIYYIIDDKSEDVNVQVLNLNQKNWTKTDKMNWFADRGYVEYQKLRDFFNKYDGFSVGDCLSLCSGMSGNDAGTSSNYKDGKKGVSSKRYFDDGKWVGKNFERAYEWADRIVELGKYYPKNTKSMFIRTMVFMFKLDKFDYHEFVSKLKKQPGALVDRANMGQYKMDVENIYNYNRKGEIIYLRLG